MPGQGVSWKLFKPGLNRVMVDAQYRFSSRLNDIMQLILRYMNDGLSM